MVRAAVMRLPFVAVIFAVLSTAQEKVIAPKFALEITREGETPPEYVILDREGSLLLQNLSAIALPDHPSQDPRPSGLRIVFKVDGDTVSMNASVAFGTVDKKNQPTSADHRSYRTIKNFVGGLDEPLVLSELANFDLRPISLKIVTARPPRPTRPTAISYAPSLQIEIVDEDRVFYNVAVHNISSRSVTEFLIAMPSGESVLSSVQEGDGSHEVIAPGATRHVQFGVPRGGRWVSGTFVPDASPVSLILEGAVFADGTAEGREATVAVLQGRPDVKK